MDPEEDPEEEEEDGGAQDMDATRRAKSAVMKTSTRQVGLVIGSLSVALFKYSVAVRLVVVAVAVAVHGSHASIRRRVRVRRTVVGYAMPTRVVLSSAAAVLDILITRSSGKDYQFPVYSNVTE